MTYSANNLYNQSAAKTFRSDTSSQLDPFILRGSRSVYRPSLPLMIEYLLMGKSPLELSSNEYITTLQEAMQQWAYNMTPLTGTNIMAAGSPGMINVLPAGNFNFTVYEDEVFEPTKFSLAAVTDTAENKVKLTLSSTLVNGVTPIVNFHIDDLIVNFSKSASVVTRVETISTTENYVVVVPYGATSTIATTLITTASADGNITDTIEIVGTACDLRNGTRPSAITTPDFRAVTGISTYNVQLFQDVWEVSNTFDGQQRAFGGTVRPQLQRNKLDCMYRHLNRLSRAIIWGQAQDVTATGDRQGWNGLYNSISTNVNTLSDGFLSLSDIDEMLVDKLGGTYSSNVLYGFCSIPTMQIIESLFNSLASNSIGSFVRYSSGMYGLEVGVIRYRGREIHLMPVADFMNFSDRTFPDQTGTAAARYAGNLFLIDPEAVYFTVGSHQEKGAVFFNVDENIQNPEETFYLQRHAIRTLFGMCLRHQKTSGLIKNIQRADLVG